MSKKLIVSLVLWLVQVLAVSHARADIACDAKRPDCEGSAALAESPFKLVLTNCGNSPTAELEYRADGAASADPNRIECTLDAKAIVGGTYTCTVPPALQKPNLSGTLTLKQPTCAGGQPVADVGAPTPRAPLAPESASGDGSSPNDSSGAASDVPSPRFLPEASWQQVLRELGLPLARRRPGNYYDRSGDVAVVFFDADGDAYYPMLDVIDEDDDIYVVIADYPSRLAQATVSFTGCNRPPVEPRVYGRTPEGGTKVDPQQPIEFIVRPLGKCAGAETGGPQVIVKRNNVQQAQTIPVNPLYRFAVGIAAAYDGTRQREFFLNTLPGETVPRIAESRELIGLSSLIYISFYPSARDYRKTDPFLWQRTQLFVGLDPRAFDEHLVVGVGYELTMGLNALAGWRIVTRQPVLSEGSGLSPGMTFDGDSRDLPTRERWERGGVFLGVGLSSSLLSRLK